MAAQGFIHNMNPVFARFRGIDFYYYGLAYAVGFLGTHLWLRKRRKALGWSVSETYDFSILFSLCVLLLGRVFSVVVYHWDYYRDHPGELLSYWRGGMASHGVLLGGVGAMFLFCRLRGKSFPRVADEVVISAAFLLAMGRIGNFINGQICGTVTDAWWGVKFPNVDGFRHPVTLYESLKNLLIIPVLLVVRRRSPPGRGMMAAHFVFWYGFLRIFTDLCRDHGAELFGIGRNQYFNALMAVFGLVLIAILARRAVRRGAEHPARQAATEKAAGSDPGKSPSSCRETPASWVQRVAFTLILLFCLVVRSAWTPEVLERRRARRAGAGASARVVRQGRLCGCPAAAGLAGFGSGGALRRRPSPQARIDYLRCDILSRRGSPPRRARRGSGGRGSGAGRPRLRRTGRRPRRCGEAPGSRRGGPRSPA